MDSNLPPYDALAYPGPSRSRRLLVHTLMPIFALLGGFRSAGPSIDPAPMKALPYRFLCQNSKPVAQCEARNVSPTRREVGKRETNPRWIRQGQ
ncbi:hypothetical protein B0I35DRAFT_447076 [Stachybotrys elegans]|uniref:Uncharacterized protein n=1 Tax=Stachybotrys elegans TaxID=80388 RepID=A0A8K0SGK1_9HYPO|nr:hypothetical protein B0I35DRAFT_447076 [Stachybotrys elegans]